MPSKANVTRAISLAALGALGGFLAPVVTAVAGSSVVHAAPEGFLALPQTRETVIVERNEASITIEPSIKFGQATDGRLQVDVHLESDLGELQPVLVAALAKDYENSDCGTRLRAHSVSLRPHGVNARLEGTIKYERWECLKTEVPEFRGLELTVKLQTVAKMRLFEQSAKICVDLHPVIEDEGRRLRLDAQVTCAQPSVNSVLGGLSSLLSLEDDFRRLAQDSLRDLAGEKLTFIMPEEVRAIDPRLTSVRFVDRGGGRLGFEARATATATADSAAELMRSLQ